MKENWNEIESVFHAALEIPAARRREFLESKCSGNQRLLSDVESLIDSFESDSAFLNEPVFDAGLKTLERKLDNNLEGKTIGAYVIEERIGVGGMGEVYRAVDTRLDRTVALKFLSEDLENDRTARRRLEKEARAAAALDHPNICAVYGLEHIGRQQFIVMQHFKGVTLGEYLKERKLGIDEFRSLAKQIIGAVAFAHSHGVIHRDLKPGNIMVTADGSIKVLDFGLAKVVNPLAEPAGDDDSRFSTNGLIIGTVSYMSPEQLRGEKLDFRSDIFSLGIILCEMLTGKNPFARPTQAETIAAIINGIPQIPTDQTASHQRIRNLLHRCISPNRDVRPESGLEVQIGIESESIRTTWWRFGLIVPILILIVALLGIGYYLSPVRAAKPVVAVLPFRPEDGLQESRTRAESVSQSIIDRLARVNSISLKSGFLTSRYSEVDLDLAKIASELSADAIVIGSLSNDGSVIATKIYRSIDGSYIDESQYALNDDSILGIPEDISMRILGRIIRTIPAEDRRAVARPETTSSEAKRFYDIARIQLRDRDRLDDAIENFVKAKDLDLNYAKAWAGLAEAYLGKSVPGAPRARSPHFLIRDAKSCAAQALELDPFLPDAQYSLGLIALKYEWTWEEAERSFRRALELDSDFIRARSGLINVLVFQSRFDEALEQANEIRRRDPVSFVSEVELAQIYYRMGDFGKMADILTELEAKNPDNQRVAYLRTFHLLATQRYEEALAIIGPIYENGKDLQKIYAGAPYGYALGKLGRNDKARAVISDLGRVSALEKVYVPSQESALIYLGMGDYKNTIRQLKRSCDEKFPSLPGWVTDPIVAEIRATSPFAEIARCTRL